MTTSRILQQNSTHKAVQENGVINIYLKGIPKDHPDMQGLPEFCYHDEKLWTIGIEYKEDLFAIFERLDEDNRINVAEANAAMNS